MKIQPESLSSYSVVIYMLNLLIQDNFLLRRNEGGWAVGRWGREEKEGGVRKREKK